MNPSRRARHGSAVLPEEPRQPGEQVVGLRRIGDDDLDLAKRRIGRARHALAPDECRARLRGLPLASAGRGPGCFELSGGEPVLRDPQGERALLQQRGGVRGLRDGAHPGGERDREDGECHENFD